MHRDKVCRPAEEQAAELIKVDEYLKLLDRFTAALKDNNRDLETYELSGQILSLNPEHYTVWNRRRSLMVAAGPNSEALVSQDQGLRELEFTLQCFKKNPKSYWIWCHRRWVLLHMPSPPWRQELAAAAHILSKDARNFHAWDYRQWVVKISRISTPLEELEYTTSKIRENFSNYSAWHYRSTLIPQAFKDSKELGEFLVKDLELVRNAVYTEPNDQSSWFYQRWLLSSPFLCDKATLEHELTFMKDLIDLEPNCAGKYLRSYVKNIFFGGQSHHSKGSKS